MLLGRTASGLYWLFRYIERAENVARIVDAGSHVALTGDADRSDVWPSVLRSAGVDSVFPGDVDHATEAEVADFLLRNRKENSSSVLSCIDLARSNGRMVRTALTREVWESLNEAWMTMNASLSGPIDLDELVERLEEIKRQTAQIRGAFFGTMMRDDRYSFCRLGTYSERLDNTARIMDVKYYVLLPSSSWVGTPLDNHQWRSILRSVSAHRSFTSVYGTEFKSSLIAEFLILDRTMPRSLTFCAAGLDRTLGYLAEHYSQSQPCDEAAHEMLLKLRTQKMDEIFEMGLHDFLQEMIRQNSGLSMQIATDYNFS
ncbi:A alpha-helical domain with a conserved ER moti [Notoacmeibacter marinus]|uniref:A alpha-helical domain with a conserved ER moti n=1 Tax=Notoacmeibacter marinus TaxID=1876515 RepID=A0A231UTA4_9HYPH|nr:alpha-E domain-containing protein [Notoacmeibacter marinus]OXS99177.1 A alpha-helical domain with a conserved ER moti [Notoacmeibacter marinus]